MKVIKLTRVSLFMRKCRWTRSRRTVASRSSRFRVQKTPLISSSNQPRLVPTILCVILERESHLRTQLIWPAPFSQVCTAHSLRPRDSFKSHNITTTHKLTAKGIRKCVLQINISIKTSNLHIQNHHRIFLRQIKRWVIRLRILLSPLSRTRTGEIRWATVRRTSW